MRALAKFCRWVTCRIVVGCCFVLGVLVLDACNRPTEPVVVQAHQTSGASDVNDDSDDENARKYLQLAINAYRTAGAYSDNAYVRLRFPGDGEPKEERAPLAVRYQSPNRLSLQAYGVQYTCDGMHITATIHDPETRNLDGQCLRGIAPSELTLDQIYQDPLLAQSACAGMGGPAPQLELLLSDSPLAAWLEEPAQLSLGESTTLEGRPIERVRITAGELEYVLWIERQSYLVRRIELPWQAMASQLAIDSQPEQASLSIEFENAQFSSSLPDEAFICAVPPMAQAVTELVPPPPAAPHPLVGKQAATSFELQDAQQQFKVTQLGSDSKATVLLWVAKHELSRRAALALQQLIGELPEAVAPQVRAMIVMAEPEQPSTSAEMMKTWGIDLPWCDDRAAVGRDAFQISRAPCLVVLGHDGQIDILEQDNLDAESLQSLPSLFERIISGESLGKAAQEQFSANQARYRRSIAASAALPIPLTRSAAVLARRAESDIRNQSR